MRFVLTLRQNIDVLLALLVLLFAGMSTGLLVTRLEANSEQVTVADLGILKGKRLLAILQDGKCVGRGLLEVGRTSGLWTAFKAMVKVSQEGDETAQKAVMSVQAQFNVLGQMIDAKVEFSFRDLKIRTNLTNIQPLKIASEISKGAANWRYATSVPGPVLIEESGSGQSYLIKARADRTSLQGPIAQMFTSFPGLERFELKWLKEEAEIAALCPSYGALDLRAVQQWISHNKIVEGIGASTSNE